MVPIAPNSKRPPDEQIVEALTVSSGLVSVAAQKLNVSRATLYGWLRSDEDLQKELHHVRETMKDLAEGKLLTAINNDDLTAIIFYLKTQAKDRGYVERHEFDSDPADDKTFILEIQPDEIEEAIVISETHELNGSANGQEKEGD